MNVFRTPDQMRHWSYEQRCAGKTVGFVPTMGALHDGHLALMRASVLANDVTVLSVFVNPAQFAPHEDFDDYPRTWEEDKRKAIECGVDAIYSPAAKAMYFDDYATYVEVERLQDGLCGVSRPHFFKGVATVVAKLFNAVVPHRAYFGEKDAQQTAVIRRMVRDLDFGIEIVPIATVRENDGLAMSSRNAYLSPGEREKALAISRALFDAKEMMEEGEGDASYIIAKVREALGDLDVDYVELVDGANLRPLGEVEGKVLLAVAALVGKTRLIDNIQYEVSETCSSRFSRAKSIAQR